MNIPKQDKPLWDALTHLYPEQPASPMESPEETKAAVIPSYGERTRQRLKNEHLAMKIRNSARASLRENKKQ